MTSDQETSQKGPGQQGPASNPGTALRFGPELVTPSLPPPPAPLRLLITPASRWPWDPQEHSQGFQGREGEKRSLGREAAPEFLNAAWVSGEFYAYAEAETMGGRMGGSSTETRPRSFHQEGTNFSRTPLCSLGLGCAAVPNTQPNVFVASARKGSFPLTQSPGWAWRGRHGGVGGEVCLQNRELQSKYSSKRNYECLKTSRCPTCEAHFAKTP